MDKNNKVDYPYNIDSNSGSNSAAMLVIQRFKV